MTERECIYQMNRMRNLGSAAFEKLMAWYGSAQTAWEQEKVPLGEKTCEEWEAAHRPERQDALRRELEGLAALGIRFLCREEFPEALRHIPSPPLGLYLRGQLPAPETDLVAMVGARRCTEYGKQTALELAGRLAEEGVGIVSGMAMGIDSWSQWGAVSRGGYSLAVLGSGIDVCYPPSGRKLYDRLAAEGGILSEYGPGEKGMPYHFPLRNRLISGLAKVVLVLEAREKSGSLITVDYALEQGREVLALPGRIGDPLSQGCNQLIRQGAGILTGAADVLLVLGRVWEREEEQERAMADPAEGLPERERAVYAVISAEPVHPEELLRRTGVTLSELFSLLWELESRGLIRQCGGGMYLRTSSQ